MAHDIGRDRQGRKKKQRPPKPLTPARLEKIALDYLARYGAPRASLLRVLRRRLNKSLALQEEEGEVPKGQALAEGEAMIQALLEKLTTAGLLNDLAYAQGRVHALSRRGLPTRAIRQRLTEKGLDAADIGRAIQSLREESENEDPDLAAARAYVRKRRLGRDPERDLAKLARRGFSYEIARKVLESCAQRED